MTVPHTAGVLFLLLACGPNLVSAQPPSRGCVMLVPSAITFVSAEELSQSDLCVPDGQAVGYLSVWDTMAWTGKVVPPYNRVTMTPLPGDTPATVTVRTASGLYKAEVAAFQDCTSVPPPTCRCSLLSHQTVSSDFILGNSCTW
jgi:hypothetical protein